MKKLPSIALGTWSWGTGFAGGDQIFGNNLNAGDLKQVFDTAMKAGFNLWDTAAAYGMGSSESIAMQHGMVWISLGEIPMQANGVNRLGSWSGAIAQADNDSPEVTPDAEDKLTAELLGKRVANLVLRFN